MEISAKFLVPLFFYIAVPVGTFLIGKTLRKEAREKKAHEYHPWR